MANTVITIDEKFDLSIVIKSIDAQRCQTCLMENGLKFDIKRTKPGVDGYYEVVVYNVGLAKANTVRVILKHKGII